MPVGHLRRFVGTVVLGREKMEPPDCARGIGGSMNRSRSRPGSSLDGSTGLASAAGTYAIATTMATRHAAEIIYYSQAQAVLSLSQSGTESQIQISFFRRVIQRWN